MSSSLVTHEIRYRDVVLNVEGYYCKEEPRVSFYSDLSGYPGAPAEFQINAIMSCDQDICELLSYEQERDIEIIILNTYYGHEY